MNEQDRQSAKKTLKPQKSEPIARVKGVNRPITSPKPRELTDPEDQEPGPKRKIKVVDPERPFLSLPEETVLMGKPGPNELIDDSVEILYNQTLKKILEENKVVLPKKFPKE